MFLCLEMLSSPYMSGEAQWEEARIEEKEAGIGRKSDFAFWYKHIQSCILIIGTGLEWHFSHASDTWHSWVHSDSKDTIF